MTTLTNSDKISIINQHKTNLDYAKYNVQMSILEEQAASSPNQTLLDSLNDQVAEIDRKLKALDDEMASLV